MTNHEIFKQVSTHLLSQAETCMGNNVCMYRYNGLACAIGCLIPDDMYDPEMEGKSVHLLMRHFPKVRIHFDLQIRGMAMLEELQDLHDSADPQHWAGRLDAVGRHYELQSV